MDDQDLALGKLVATMPAMALADAAAQLYVAAGVMEYMDDFDLPPVSIARSVAKLRRMLRSVLPVEAAGLDLDAIGGEGTAEQCASEFPELAAWPASGAATAVLPEAAGEGEAALPLAQPVT